MLVITVSFAVCLVQIAAARPLISTSAPTALLDEAVVSSCCVVHPHAVPCLACCLHVCFVQVAVRVLPIATDIDMDDVDTTIPANKGAEGAVNMKKP